MYKAIQKSMLMNKVTSRFNILKLLFGCAILLTSFWVVVLPHLNQNDWTIVTRPNPTGLAVHILPQPDAVRHPNSKKIIAFYFPQFHEFAVNNRLWGKGYTDFLGVQLSTVAKHSFPVLRPVAGFYALTDKLVRQRQAATARKYNIHGFAIYHYWFKGGPVMEDPLNLLLDDGEPDIHFCLAWANEHWTRRWDGGDNAVLMNQTYERADWLPHWSWMLKFFRHKNYIFRDGKPMLIIYRTYHFHNQLEPMLKFWREQALAAGLNGLHLVQMNGGMWIGPQGLQQHPAVDGIAEFWPSLYNGVGLNSLQMSSLRPEDFGAAHDNYYFGVHAGWNNKPRHLQDGKETIIPYHPSILKFTLRRQLARTAPDSFVFINAWNEWGEGAAIEPSAEMGYSWLQAIKDAVDEDANSTPFLAPAGLGKGTEFPARVCIAVRTYVKHDDGAMFSLRTTLASLLNFSNHNWDAFIFNTDSVPFANLSDIVSSFRDPRLHVVSTPSSFVRKYDEHESAYELSDYVLNKYCLSTGNFGWFILTNGDNFYTTDALNILPVHNTDMVLMNFFGRWHYINSFKHGGMATEHCCTRLEHFPHCPLAQPLKGLADVGGMVISSRSWISHRLNFSMFHRTCDTSCHDGALAEHVDQKLGWRILTHPFGVCTFHHNPNPISCKLVGGIYVDAGENEAGCYDIHSLPIPLDEVDWVKFFAPAACICRKHS